LPVTVLIVSNNVSYTHSSKKLHQRTKLALRFLIRNANTGVQTG